MGLRNQHGLSLSSTDHNRFGDARPGNRTFLPQVAQACGRCRQQALTRRFGALPVIDTVLHKGRSACSFPKGWARKEEALAVEMALQHDRVMILSMRHMLILNQPRGVFHQGVGFGNRVYLRDPGSNPKTVLV